MQSGSDSPALRMRSCEQVTSTNDVVKEAARSGEPEGFAVIAKRQTAGYGQRGSKWDSPDGGIYLSMLLRPSKSDESIKELGQVAAVGVVRALHDVLGPDGLGKVSFKWPNDIIVIDEGVPADPPYRKLCGISTELKDGALCVGIGINAQSDAKADANAERAAAEAADGRNRIVHLDELGAQIGRLGQPSLGEVAESVATSVWDAYSQWSEEGFGPFAFEYASRLRGEDAALFAKHFSDPCKLPEERGWEHSR